VHAHDDFAVLDRLACEPKVMQGVTTEVIGNCGFGAAPLSPVYEQVLSAFGGTLFGPLGDLSWKSTESFLTHLQTSRPAINVSALVPHAPVRVAVMGADARKPSPGELDAMRALVREGMEAGAVGLSTGLFYSPGSFAEIDEIVDLAEVVAEHRGVYAIHVRDEADHVRDDRRSHPRRGRRHVAVQIRTTRRPDGAPAPSATRRDGRRCALAASRSTRRSSPHVRQHDVSGAVRRRRARHAAADAVLLASPTSCTSSRGCPRKRPRCWARRRPRPSSGPRRATAAASSRSRSA
jgi:N-acyl-D-aspartate/D-glutamate deacylase